MLNSIGWERVDIFNPEGMSPYKDLVVMSEWLNSEGTDIVRHLVDNAPNKPPEEGGSSTGGSRRGTVDEEDEVEGGGGEAPEVVEDLISGLDDDSA